MILVIRVTRFWVSRLVLPNRKLSARVRLVGVLLLNRVSTAAMNRRSMGLSKLNRRLVLISGS